MNPCPFCGGDKGYKLHDGETYRWWMVTCKACGAGVTECPSDRRTQIGTELPEHWPAADEAWAEAGAYAAGLASEVERLRAELAASSRGGKTP